MKLALYKGRGNIYDRIIRLATCSKYSHCELVIDDVCYSSSPRDGGVRMKGINVYTNDWDVIDVPGDKIYALKWFVAHVGKKYDYLGAISSILPINLDKQNKFFCSEAIAYMLQLPYPRKHTPNTLKEYFCSK
jgi:uncharacterized protein YycO